MTTNLHTLVRSLLSEWQWDASDAYLANEAMRRLEAIQAQAELERTDPHAFDWIGWHDRRVAEELQHVETFLAAVPESRRDAVVALLRRGWVWSKLGPPQQWEPSKGYGPPYPFRFEHTGLQVLLSSLSSGHWIDPPAIPEAVIDALLADPRLELFMTCAPCNLHLPYVNGTWTKAGKPGVEINSPLVPFPECPVCAAVVWPVEQRPSRAPHVATDGWTFKSYKECFVETYPQYRGRVWG